MMYLTLFLPLDELPHDPPTSEPLPSHPPGVNEGEVALGDENDTEEGSGFHRRYAKRGMTFRPRTEGTPTNSSRGMLCVYSKSINVYCIES